MSVLGAFSCGVKPFQVSERDVYYLFTPLSFVSNCIALPFLVEVAFLCESVNHILPLSLFSSFTSPVVHVMFGLTLFLLPEDTLMFNCLNYEVLQSLIRLLFLT